MEAMDANNMSSGRLMGRPENLEDHQCKDPKLGFLLSVRTRGMSQAEVDKENDFCCSVLSQPLADGMAPAHVEGRCSTPTDLL